MAERTARRRIHLLKRGFAAVWNSVRQSTFGTGAESPMSTAAPVAAKASAGSADPRWRACDEQIGFLEVEL